MRFSLLFFFFLIGSLVSLDSQKLALAQSPDLVGDLSEESDENISETGDGVGAPSQAGETSIDLNVEKIDKYSDAQKEAIGAMETLLSNVKGSSTGTISRVKDLSDDAINYLTGTYLYCISNKGVCAEMLEAILEMDIINSKLSNAADCPNMVRFWRKWLSNDFEERAKLSMKTGYLTQVQDFTLKVRPAFVQCKPTVEKAISQGPTVADFLKARYGGESSRPVASIDTTVKTLSAIKSTVSNVFVAMGAQSSGGQGGGKKGEKDKKRGPTKSR